MGREAVAILTLTLTVTPTLTLTLTLALTLTRREAVAVVQEQACLALGNIASAHSNIATQQRALELGALDPLPHPAA